MTAAKKATPAKKGAEPYTVLAPLIQVEVGSQILQYSFGDVLPDGINESNLEHLVENGLIQKGEVIAQPESSTDDE